MLERSAHWAASGALLASLILSSAPAVAAQTKAPAPAEASKIKVEKIADGLENPWGLAFLPDGRMLITEKPGRLRVVTSAGDVSEPVIGVPAVSDAGQGGLLDVAVSPDFATDATIYLSYAEPRDGKNGTSVARAKIAFDGNAGRLDDLKVIFRQEPSWDSGYHFGSRIAFAKDGSLFVTTGERNFARKEAQNPANHIGKVIHITPNGAPAAGNPGTNGWDPKVWSIGHRNLQGAFVHPETGQLWTVEHGARGGDELNHPEAGKNYGWPLITYGIDYSGAKIGDGTKRDGLEQPVYYWDPSIAPAGLLYYTGDLFPAWKGNLLVGALRQMHLARLVIENGQVVSEEQLLKDANHRIRDVVQGPDGAVWLLTDEDDGHLLRLTPEG